MYFPNPADLVVDFTLDNGFLAQNITNKVYFTVWSDSTRSNPLDIVNASLKYKTTNAKKVTTETILLNRNISSIFRGKGYFLYTPVPGTTPYIEISIEN